MIHSCLSRLAGTSRNPACSPSNSAYQTAALASVFVRLDQRIPGYLRRRVRFLQPEGMRLRLTGPRCYPLTSPEALADQYEVGVASFTGDRSAVRLVVPVRPLEFPLRSHQARRARRVIRKPRPLPRQQRPRRSLQPRARDRDPRTCGRWTRGSRTRCPRSSR